MERGTRILYTAWAAVLVPLNVMLACGVVAAALAPGALGMVGVWRALSKEHWVWRTLAVCALGPFGFVAFGLVLALLAGLIGRAYALPSDGVRFSVFSWNSIRWGFYGFWTGIAHLTMLPRIMPFAFPYWRLMGARVGRRIFMPNPAGVGDFALLTFGDDVFIASDVVIIAHTARRGEILLEPVRIGNRVTLGTQAILSGGVEIGDDAIVLPTSYVLPRTKIGPGEIWGGVPAAPWRPQPPSTKDE